MPVHHSVRPSPIFLAIVAVTAVGGALAWWDGAQTGALAYASVFVLVIAGWVVSLCLHEFGHAFSAGRHRSAGRRCLLANVVHDVRPAHHRQPGGTVGEFAVGGAAAGTD